MENKQKQNARLGAIGENYVQMRLMQQGWDAFNANSTYNNYKAVDIVCLKPEEGKAWKPRTALIQVKTTRKKQFPLGFTIDQCLDKNYLREHVIGPWAFVAVDSEKDMSTFRCYVLTREQVIELANKAHDWYKFQWKREKEINGTSVAALNEEWLYGEIKKTEGETSQHPAFVNPLKGVQTREAWDNIWIE